MGTAPKNQQRHPCPHTRVPSSVPHPKWPACAGKPPTPAIPLPPPAREKGWKGGIFPLELWRDTTADRWRRRGCAPVGEARCSSRDSRAAQKAPGSEVMSGSRQASPGASGVPLPSCDAFWPPSQSGRWRAPHETLAVVGGARGGGACTGTRQGRI